jgi:hypothetical protein
VRRIIIMLALCVGAFGCSPANRSGDGDTAGVGAAPRTQTDHSAAEHPEYGPVTAALGAHGYVMMRRIEAIPSYEINGTMVDKVIKFRKDFFRVLSDERRVPDDQAAALRNALVHSLEERYIGFAFCDMDPGLYVSLHATNGDGSDLYVGDGLICFLCGEWDFDFQTTSHRQGDAVTFVEYFSPSTFNTLLAAACATFPEDAALKAIKPRQ